jgi:hypothetical protein
VTNTNDGPEIISIPILSAVEDSTYTYDVNASDVDVGDVLSYKLDYAPNGLSIDAQSGVISWLPTNDDVGENAVKVNVTDSNNTFDTQEFTINVSNTNDDPEIISTPITEVDEDAFYTYDVNASDVDVGDVLSYNFDLAPQGMTIDSQTGVISWVPTNEFVGDNHVTNTNDGPEIISIPILSAVEDSTYTYDVNASDVDVGEVLYYKFDYAPEGMEIDSSTGEISWLPSNDFVGSNDVAVNATDAAQAYNVQEFSIWVSNVNDEPVLDPLPDVTAVEDEPFEYQVNAEDVDLYDKISFYDDTSLFDINKNTGMISFTPTNDDVGTYTIRITVSDTDGLSDDDTIRFTVINSNDPPVLDFISNFYLTEDVYFSYFVQHHTFQHR